MSKQILIDENKLKLALDVLISYGKSPYIKQSHPKRWANGNKAIKTLEEALAKQEQGEPVAWRLESGQAVWFERTDPEASSALPNDVTAIPLYTTQQQRTWERPWVSLTDEEIDYYIVHRCGVATKKNLVELIRLCEIKLKEKNT
jgi:hypothetical protein